jgi:hypothetical protein
MSRKKEHGYDVELGPQLPETKMNMLTPAEYKRQAIVFFALGLASWACIVVSLPPAVDIALPLFVRVLIGVGFFATGASNWVSANGMDLRHPIHNVVNVVMLLSSGTIFVWFVFFAPMAVPWKIVSGFVFGLMTFIFIIPFAMRIIMPGAIEQAMSSAQLEMKRARKKDKR